MAQQAIFAGLVVDEQDRVVNVSYVGEESTYVVDDAGFKRHIPSEQVDRQVLAAMQDQIKGHEDVIMGETAKLLGQEDIFTRAMIMNQLKHMDQQFESLMKTGIPENERAYLGMLGFRVVINIHGEVIEVRQPGKIAPEDE
jgi:hypothetical protein